MRASKMETFVAESLQIVARCKPLAVATCNKSRFAGRFTYETPVAMNAINAPKKKPFVALFQNFVAAVADSIAAAFSAFFCQKSSVIR